jgi:DedD protein
MFKKASPQSSNSPQNLDDVRRQSRHRLIGASLLVAAAVFGFPLVFDTQPRPISVDLPIHIPAQPAVSPLTPVAAAPSAPNVPAADTAPTPAPAVVAPVKPVVKPPAPAAKEPAKPDATGERFVVQVGAYADVASARTVRQKIERAGLKTYTQVAKTSQGNRIRVRLGPFTTRAEADKVAQKIKSLGLTPGVLTL